MMYKRVSLTYDCDKEDVLRFFQKNDSYLKYQDGIIVVEKRVKDFFFGELPPSKTYDDKVLIGYYRESTLICVFDLLKRYPNESTWVIGLMLMDEDLSGRGIGSRLYQLIEDYILRHNVVVIRLGVLDDNITGIHFWRKRGFEPTGESKLHEDNRKIIVMEKVCPKLKF